MPTKYRGLTSPPDSNAQTACRTAIWQWIQTRIIPKSSNSALKNERGNYYRSIYEAGKKKKQPDIQVRGRIRHQAVEDLFYALVEALTH